MNIHRELLMITLAVLAFAVTGYCQQNPTDLNAPVCQVISLPYLDGEIALSLGEQKVVEKLMPCFLKLWAVQLPSAEAASRNISNSFLFVMGENPQAFFDAMATQADVFAEWLKQVRRLSFPPGSPSCHLQQKRSVLLHVLESSHVAGAQQQALRKSAISALSEIPNNKKCL